MASMSRLNSEDVKMAGIILGIHDRSDEAIKDETYPALIRPDAGCMYVDTLNYERKYTSHFSVRSFAQLEEIIQLSEIQDPTLAMTTFERTCQFRGFDLQRFNWGQVDSSESNIQSMLRIGEKFILANSTKLFSHVLQDLSHRHPKLLRKLLNHSNLKYEYQRSDGKWDTMNKGAVLNIVAFHKDKSHRFVEIVQKLTDYEGLLQESPEVHNFKKTPLHTAAMRQNEAMLLSEFAELEKAPTLFRHFLLHRFDEFNNNVFIYLVQNECVECLQSILDFIQKGNPGFITLDDFQIVCQRGRTAEKMFRDLPKCPRQFAKHQRHRLIKEHKSQCKAAQMHPILQKMYIIAANQEQRKARHFERELQLAQEFIVRETQRNHMALALPPPSEEVLQVEEVKEDIVRTEIEEKEFETWNPLEVQQWLVNNPSTAQSLGVQLGETLLQNRVTGADLKHLSDEDLQSFGISVPYRRRKLLQCIAKLGVPPEVPLARLCWALLSLVSCALVHSTFTLVAYGRKFVSVVMCASPPHVTCIVSVDVCSWFLNAVS